MIHDKHGWSLHKWPLFNMSRSKFHAEENHEIDKTRNTSNQDTIFRTNPHPPRNKGLIRPYRVGCPAIIEESQIKQKKQKNNDTHDIIMVVKDYANQNLAFL